MPLTEKGKKIKKAMEKQYGKKKAEKIFYASKNAGKISGVEKAKMGKEIKNKKNKSEFKDNPKDRFGEYRTSKASKGKMISRKSGSPKKGEKKSGQSDKKGGDIFIKLAKSKLGLKGGGAAIRGTNFKGVF